MAGHFFFFLALGLLVHFGSHLFVLYSAVRFFDITRISIRYALSGIFLILSVCFFAASTLAHWEDNIFTHYFYFASGFWLGLLVNLVLACAIIWPLYPFIRNQPLLAWISSALILFAFSLSVFGSYSSFHPRLKEISVSIRELPEDWHGRRIVQLSDIHLGHIYRAGFAKEIFDRVNALDPDLVLITGDLFDGMDGNLAEFIPPLGSLRSERGVFFVTGNHETYLGIPKTAALLEQVGIRILDDQAVSLAGLQIIGSSYPPRDESGSGAKDLTKTVAAMANFSPTLPTILLHHAPVDIAAAKKLGIDLQLSGHTHRGQLFPLNLITRWIYKGYDYGLKTEGDFTIYTTNGVGTWGPPMRTFNPPEIVIIELDQL